MRALYLALPIVLALAALLFIGMGLQEPVAETVAPAAEPPRYAVTGAQWLRLGAQGQPEFRAQAESIEYFTDESATLRAITLDALGGLSSPWVLRAKTGSVPPRQAQVRATKDLFPGRPPPRERRLLLQGDVIVQGHYTDGAPIEFTTDRLWVDLLRHELRTEAPVLLTSDLRRASARGLKADFSGENVQLLDDVQVEYAPRT